MEKDSILIVEDDSITLKLLQYVLEKDDFYVWTAKNGTEAKEQLSFQNINVVLLDINLPNTNGFKILEFIRKHPIHRDVPVLMLTNNTSKLDTVLGLEMGADDYITKPFISRELVTRIKVCLRRTKQKLNSGSSLFIKEIELDLANRTVKRQGSYISLTIKEYELLHFMSVNAGKIFSREALLHHVWGDKHNAKKRTIDVHIASLRKKIGDINKDKRLIETVSKVGYKVRL